MVTGHSIKVDALKNLSAMSFVQTKRLAHPYAINNFPLHLTIHSKAKL